jgi:hypothetical protein
METQTKKRMEHEAEAGAGGAIAGAVIGSFAGPPGAVVGAVVGAAAGAIAVAIAEHESASVSARNAELDRAIGVTDGEIGAPNLEHPPESRKAVHFPAPQDEAPVAAAPVDEDSWFEPPPS